MLLVAVVLAVAAFTVACGDDGDSAATTTSAPTTTTMTTSTTTTTTATDGPEAVREAVDAFFAAVADGDLDEAWSLVAEPSRVDVGGFEAFQELRSGLAEGYGAWSAASERTIDVVDVRAGIDIAIVRGLVAQEGPEAPGATSLVVRTDADGARVSPFEEAVPDGSAVTFEPAPPAAVDPTTPVHVTVPAGRETRVIVDAEEPLTPESVEEGQATVTYEVPVPAGGVTATLVAMTAVVTGPDGDVMARSALYEVAPAPRSAEDVATSFFSAWQEGDTATLERLAVPAAVDDAEAASGATDRRWTFERCEGAAGSVFCSWTANGSTATVRVSNVDAEHPVTEFVVDA